MVAKAFILIETQVGKNREVTTALKNFKGVASVDVVTGPYDIIATVVVDSLNEIGEMVTGRIHPVPGITRTVTCLSIWSP